MTVVAMALGRAIEFDPDLEQGPVAALVSQDIIVASVVKSKVVQRCEHGHDGYAAAWSCASEMARGRHSLEDLAVSLA